jgi:hypothetical protein
VAEDKTILQTVQMTSGAHPASYSVGLGSHPPRVKGLYLTTSVHLVLRLRMCRAVAPLHLPSWSCASWITGTTLPWPVTFNPGSFFYCWTKCHTADSNVAEKWLPVSPLQNNLHHSTVEESAVLTVYCTG